MHQKKPSLSILLPAYNYPRGIRRILEKIECHLDDNIEVIIADNSTGSPVLLEVQEFISKYPNNIFYHHHSPTTGPIKNWNWILAHASGDYCVLIHHDEYPQGDNYIPIVLEEINQNPTLDFFLFEVVLDFPKQGISVKHISAFVQRVILRYFPEYLFRRNVVGPTAALVIRRSIFPLFDEKLAWLVDVDMYYRLFSKDYRWKMIKNQKIFSEQQRFDSLTAEIGKNRERICCEELQYIGTKFSISAPWIKTAKVDNVISRLSNGVKCEFEKIIWYTYRALSRGIFFAKFISAKIKVFF